MNFPGFCIHEPYQALFKLGSYIASNNTLHETVCVHVHAHSVLQIKQMLLSRITQHHLVLWHAVHNLLITRQDAWPIVTYSILWVSRRTRLCEYYQTPYSLRAILQTIIADVWPRERVSNTHAWMYAHAHTHRVTWNSSLHNNYLTSK